MITIGTLLFGVFIIGVFYVFQGIRVQRSIRSLRWRDERRKKALLELTTKNEGDITIFLLLRALRKNPLPAIRGGAAEALGMIRPQKSAFQPLINALDDPDDLVRQEAITALGRIGDHHRSFLPLSKFLQDPHKGIRRRAILAIGELGDARAVSLLRNILEDPDAMIRKSAVEALKHIPDHRRIELLVDRLEDPNLDIRFLAASALEDLRWKPLTTQEEILYAIAKRNWESPLLSSPEAVDSLLHVLVDERPENMNARVNATLILSQIGEYRAVVPIMKMFDVAQPEIQATVVTALGDLKDDRALDLLLSALKDRNPPVRMAAALALSNFPVEPVVDALIHALGDTNPAVQGDRNPEVQRAVAEALGKIGGKRVISALKYALEDDDAIVRWQAAEMLKQSGWKPENDLEHIRIHIARGAWQALLPFGAQALPALIARSKDKDRTIREDVAVVLTQLLSVVKIVVFGNLQVKPARQKITLCNPDVMELTVPMQQLEHIAIHTPTHNFYQVEQFLTYAINHLGQDHLKKHVTVHIYGGPAQLHHNLQNTLQNLCKTMTFHQEALTGSSIQA